MYDLSNGLITGGHKVIHSFIWKFESTIATRPHHSITLEPHDTSLALGNIGIYFMPILTPRFS